MAHQAESPDILAEFLALKYEMKNQKLKKLPPTKTIQRRPLHHAPVASPYAGAGVQKVVYVSTRTPIMAAVKRVKRFLLEVEKRAIQGIKPKSQMSGSAFTDLEGASNRLAKANEEVLVKASGRAMQQALRIGNWFRTKETEMICKVSVRTSSTPAVDDIVDAEGLEDLYEAEEVTMGQHDENAEATTELTGGDTTIELLGNLDKSTGDAGKPDDLNMGADVNQSSTADRKPAKRKRRSKRKKAAYGEDEVPEARVRWVKTVEVAISLQA